LSGSIAYAVSRPMGSPSRSSGVASTARRPDRTRTSMCAGLYPSSGDTVATSGMYTVRFSTIARPRKLPREIPPALPTCGAPKVAARDSKCARNSSPMTTCSRWRDQPASATSSPSTTRVAFAHAPGSVQDSETRPDCAPVDGNAPGDSPSIQKECPVWNVADSVGGVRQQSPQLAVDDLPDAHLVRAAAMVGALHNRAERP